MKKISLFFIVILALPVVTAAQFFRVITFDDGQNMNFLSIDHSLPGNVWQIGKPQKPYFDSAYSAPNAIVTDTINSYPLNNLSVFYLYLPNEWDALGQILHFRYKINCDTLTDYGLIEFSLDKGLTWHNLLSEANAYQTQWTIQLAYPPYTMLFNNNDTLNPFTGKSSGWYTFNMPFGFYFYPLGTDTVYYKLSFHSDGNQTNKDGWMMDDLLIADLYEGIAENNSDWLISAEPNPFVFDLTLNVKSISLQNPNQQFTYEIFSDRGEKMASRNFYGNKVKIEGLEKSSAGVYFLKIRSDSVIIGTRKLIKI